MRSERVVRELVRRARAQLVVVLCLGFVAVWCGGGPAWAAGLPDGRGYELVSSGDKLGKEIVGSSMRTHAALTEAAQWPAAVAFTSLGGFADVQGTGLGTEYLSQRTGGPGTSGWVAHAITPAQQPMSFLAATQGYDPAYLGDMSPDLTHGTFRAWSPLTDDPNVANVANLYVRTDLRQPGTGNYQLASSSVTLLPPQADPFFDGRPFIAGASDDFRHVIFESRQSLTADASGTNIKLYKWDDGSLRLLSLGAFCAGVAGANGRRPCSSAGYGATAIRYTQRVLSTDGRRVAFTPRPRAAGLYQLDDRGTNTHADDAIVQVSASELGTPEVTSPATFETASADGGRVFFTSAERLTTADGGGLYLWERQASDEQQSVTVDGTGGTFTLTAHAWPSAGRGTLTNGSTTVDSVSGLFSVGQTIIAPEIPVGTTIVAIPNSSTLTLSAPATADASDETLSASIDATTSPLAHDATAGQVRAALEGLSPLGVGNVDVTGGPGGSTPYLVTFTGALGGVNVAQLTADGTGLSGGAASAAGSTTAPLQNLTLIAGPSTIGVAGASDDGHHLYFAADGQLVSRGPAVGSGLYYWQDADGAPGGTLSFIGDLSRSDTLANVNGFPWNGTRKTSRVTPDGRTLVFEVTDGFRFPLRYDHQSRCAGIEQTPNFSGATPCSEAYVYRADRSTPLAPDVVCASCNPSGAPATANAWLDIRRGASALFDGPHLSHPLSDDGSRVFFSTAEALVPEDTNGRMDAYEYDVPSGTPHLLSTGTDAFDSYFMDASANGRDVYFLTRARLVGWDTDRGYDMYDARVGGGFPEPVVPPVECAGDACQGQAAGVPAAPALASPAAGGVGNVRAVLRSSHRRVVRCRRGQVKRRVRGRVRCVKRAKAKHATSKRGAR